MTREQNRGAQPKYERYGAALLRINRRAQFRSDVVVTQVFNVTPHCYHWDTLSFACYHHTKVHILGNC